MQFDFPLIDPEVTTGTDLANILNSWSQAVESAHSGAARPPYAGQGLIWLDTSGGAANWQIKFFDGAQDIVIGTIDSTGDTFAPSVGGRPAATVDDAIAYAIALG
jgi:hypothetical protein